MLNILPGSALIESEYKNGKFSFYYDIVGKKAGFLDTKFSSKEIGTFNKIRNGT